MTWAMEDRVNYKKCDCPFKSHPLNIKIFTSFCVIFGFSLFLFCIVHALLTLQVSPAMFYTLFSPPALQRPGYSSFFIYPFQVPKVRTSSFRLLILVGLIIQTTLMLGPEAFWSTTIGAVSITKIFKKPQEPKFKYLL